MLLSVKVATTRTFIMALVAVLPTALAMAQSGDAAYCAKLADLARRYTGSAGGDGRLGLATAGRKRRGGEEHDRGAHQTTLARMRSCR